MVGTRKPGRPATGFDPLVSIRLPSDILRRLASESRSTGLARSELIRRYVADGLARDAVRTGPVIPYFGSKWRLALRYPAPVYDTIIEPFAGGAGYALRYHDRKVILVEKSAALCAIWRFLIEASAKDVLSLPDVPLTGSLRQRHFEELTLGERTLIGFWLAKGRAAPNTVPSPWVAEYPTRLWGPEIRKRLSEFPARVKHSRVINGDYTKAPNIRATYFVDATYFSTGQGYQHGSRGIDFWRLAQWCMARQGQVIVCENSDANWLPFKLLGFVNGVGGSKGSKKQSREAFYVRRSR